MNRLTADFLLLLAAAIWGLAFYFQKEAMSDIGPFLFITARALVASCTLAPLALLELRRRANGPARPAIEPRGLVRLGMMGGVVFFLGAAFQQTGLLTATITNAGFLTGLYVVITPFIIWLTARRAPTGVVWAAVGLAFTGTWALGGGTLASFSYGDGLIAFCAIFWAVHLVVTSRSPRFGAPMTFTFIQFATVAVLAAIAALIVEPISIAALARAAGPILYVGVLSSALTFTLLAIAMKHTPASEAAVLMSMETLFAALAGALLLGERLPPIGWLGAALLFSATLIVQLAPRPKVLTHPA
ncbi:MULTISPECIES: DMT family transporter [Rhodomicrobium]|uniref:DMT family transporter n=1 Tax=Rhodomicrobium TaxID=1068 RepID=UPI000B4B5FB4|nr:MULTISPECIES: DMT family transporter [Rhodomicrobium]